MEAQALIVVSGMVQGVFFRASAQHEALRLGLKGYARNLPDGDVEVVAEGEKAKLQALIEWCHHGPPSARVSHVETFWEKPSGRFSNFGVR